MSIFTSVAPNVPMRIKEDGEWLAVLAIHTVSGDNGEFEKDCHTIFATQYGFTYATDIWEISWFINGEWLPHEF